MALLGLSIPVVIAGVATAHLGLHRTALAYCAAVPGAETGSVLGAAQVARYLG
jgi:hypothetical protein